MPTCHPTDRPIETPTRLRPGSCFRDSSRCRLLSDARFRWLGGNLIALLTVVAGDPAIAHEATGAAAGGFASGFMHPLAGADHLVAMIAVGLWGAVLGAPAIWILPIAFPLVMAFGGALGVAAVPLPGVEVGIAVSALVLGLAVAAAARPPIWIAALIVAAFAVLHGHAHGVELPVSANPLAYSLGFVSTTGLLHLAGIGIASAYGKPAGRVVVRAMGAGIALAGLGFLIGRG